MIDLIDSHEFRNSSESINWELPVAVITLEDTSDSPYRVLVLVAGMQVMQRAWITGITIRSCKIYGHCQAYAPSRA